jgi:hypothetical protein
MAKPTPNSYEPPCKSTARHSAFLPTCEGLVFEGEFSVLSQAIFSFPLHNRYMTSKTTRLAAASLLTITLPLATGSMASADARQATLTPVRVQTEVVTRDITLATTRTSALPFKLRMQVQNAIASAQAATANAQNAIHACDTAELHTVWAAETSLHDAQTALDAASAELRYVIDQVALANPRVTAALHALQQDIDVLRGVQVAA